MNHQPFLLGVNMPWLRYAEDFGTTPAGHRGLSLEENRAQVAAAFSRIRDSGAKIVRWFLFADGRGGFVSENGIPQRPDLYLFADVRVALELARRSDLQLCLVLLDYLWLQDRSVSGSGGAQDPTMQFAAGREAFLHRVLIPMFQEFRQHPSLFAWEIANEPEWAIREFHRSSAAKMHYADFRAYATEIAEAVHEVAEVPVTLGSARMDWVRAWTEIGLDLYQAHYYPPADADPDSDFGRHLAALGKLDKPLWLGELPARDPRASRYSIESVLARCVESGLLGAAAWRWTAPEETAPDAPIGTIDPGSLSAWNSSQRSRSAVV